jgi:glutamine amidotransferase-like uncharacterized protein
MPIEIYKEPSKKAITEKDVVADFEITENVSQTCWSIKYKNQVIFKSSVKPTRDEVKTFLLKDNPEYLKKFMDKLKETNKKRLNSIQARKEKRKEMKEKISEETMMKQIRDSMNKNKKK